MLLIAPLKSSTPKIWGVSVEVLFLASLQAEIHLGVVLLPLHHKRQQNNLQHMRVNKPMSLQKHIMQTLNMDAIMVPEI